MTKLTFNAADVLRVAQHAKNATDWTPPVISYGTKKNGWKPTYGPAIPCVCFVHDQGVYLMSGGLPRDLVSGTEKDGTGRSFCAYAKGMNPDADEDWHSTARHLVGGDDFGEHLPWVDALLARAKLGKPITILVSKNSLRIAA